MVCEVLLRLSVFVKLFIVVVYLMCLIIVFGVMGVLIMIVVVVVDDVFVFDGWGCCVFVGDCGMLYLELIVSVIV